MSDPFQCRNGQSTVALAIVLPLVDAIALLLRLYARRRFKLALAADDWWAIVSLVLLCGLAADFLALAGLGVLACPANPDRLERLTELGPTASHITWSFYLMAIAAVGSVKMALIFCMRKVFCTGDKRSWFRLFTSALVAFVALWTVGFFVTIVVINFDWSGPSESVRDWGVDPATTTTDAVFYAMSVSDVVLDAIICIVPLGLVWRLSMSRTRKAAVTAILLLRLLALGSSVAKMIYTVQFANWMNGLLRTDPNLEKAVDVLTGMDLNTQMMWWTMLEVGIGLLANCLVTIQMLIRRTDINALFCGSRPDNAAPGMEPPMRAGFGPHAMVGYQHRASCADTSSIMTEEYMIGSIRPSLSEARTPVSDDGVFEKQIPWRCEASLTTLTAVESTTEDVQTKHIDVDVKAFLS